MVSRWTRRRTLAAVGLTVSSALAGCNSLSSAATPSIASSLGTTAYDPVVEGQPTVAETVPAVWGLVLSHPDPARKLVDWGALTPLEGDAGPGTEFRTFDPDEQFATVVVGVLPTGDGLTGYREEPDTLVGDVVADFTDRPAFVDGRLRFEVTPYRAFSPDPGTPEAHYDYTFTLWDLNGSDRPDGIDVEFHPS